MVLSMIGLKSGKIVVYSIWLMMQRLRPYQDLIKEKQLVLYLKRFGEHLASIENICSRLGLVYHRLSTDLPLETALPEVIRVRMQARGNSRTRIARR